MAAIEFDVSLHVEQLQKDIDSINQKLNGFVDQSKTSVSRLDSIFSGVGQAFAGIFAAGTITAFTSELIQAAGESYKAEAKVAQAVKQTGEAAGFTAEELGKMAKSLQEVTTFEDDQILNDVTAQLLTFTNITGANFERAQMAVLDLATVMDGDLKSAATQVGKALNYPADALSSLSRSGVQFSESQKEQIDNLIQQNRLFEAQSLILDEINHQYGGQAEAMAKMPIGKIEQLKNSWGDVKEEMGKVILESGLLGSALERLAKHGFAMSSDQLSWIQKWNPFESLDSKYEKAKKAAEDFERQQRLLESLTQEESVYIEPVIDPTVEKQIGRIRAAIAQVKTELINLRKGDIVADLPSIQRKEDQLKTLKSQLEALTGVSQKAAEDASRIEKERLEALASLSQSELELKRSTEAAKIKIMQDGALKQMAEAQIMYDQEMDRIKAQRLEMEQLLSKSGLKVGTTEYAQKQDSINATTSAAEAAAAERLAAERVRIEKDAAEKIKAIRKEITAAFLTDQQREVDAVVDKWDKIIAELNAGRGTDSDISQAEQARTDEILQIYQSYAMNRIGIDEEIALRKQEIDNRSMADQTTAQQKLLRIQKQYDLVRIAQLEKLGKEKNKAEINALKDNVTGIDKEIQKLEVSRLEGIVSGIGQINSELGETMSRLLNIGVGVDKLIENLGKGGSSVGAIGNVISIIGAVYGQIQKFNSEQQESIAKMFEIQNREIQRQINLIDQLYGADRRAAEQAAINSLKEQIKYHDELAQGTDAIIQKKYSVDPFGVIKAWGTVGKKSFEDAKEMMDWLNSPEVQQNILSGELRIKNMDQITAIVNGYTEAQEKLEDITAQEMTIRVGFDVDTVADDIAKGIEDGLKLSEDGLGDWTRNFGNLLRTTITNQIRLALEKKFLIGFMDYFNDAMIDNVLTDEETKNLENFYVAAVQGAQAMWDTLTPVLGKYDGILGQSQNEAQGLSGAIKGITEETASLIAGQFYAMREIQSKTFMNSLEQLEAINQSVSYLGEIAINTRDIRMLNNISDQIRETNLILKAHL